MYIYIYTHTYIYPQKGILHNSHSLAVGTERGALLETAISATRITEATRLRVSGLAIAVLMATNSSNSSKRHTKV